MLAWRLVALLALLLAAVGVVLPGLPTVPFLLVAAWAGGRGWPRLEAWLLDHPRWGPPIRRWRHHRAVPRRAKVGALLMMASSAVLLVLAPIAVGWRVGAVLVLAITAVWLWRRPER